MVTSFLQVFLDVFFLDSRQHLFREGFLDCVGWCKFFTLAWFFSLDAEASRLGRG